MPKRNIVWLLLVLLAAAACWKVLPLFIPDPRLVPASRDEDLSAYRPLAEIYRTIEQHYADRLDERTRRRFVEEAIRGAIRALDDPHSQYFTPAQAAEFQAELKGQFTGVGLEIDLRDGAVTVAAPIESSPAFAAGIMPGDRIVKVGELSTEQMNAEDVARLIRGRPGSEVILTVRRPGVAGTMRFALARTRIVVNPVKGFRPDSQGGWEYLLRSARASRPGGHGTGGDIGYIRVCEFIEDGDHSTMARFAAVLGPLRSAGARGLILDLRDNAGGILKQAVQMVDRFVPEGIIVARRSAHGQEVFRAGAPGTLSDWPVVVLINRRSASASEIVAGSLAAHGRAVLVGERSFGKGTMQEPIPVTGVTGGEALLKLTVAYLYLPDGRTFNRVEPPPGFDRASAGSGRPTARQTGRLGGIKPTVTVELSVEEELGIIRCRRKLHALAMPGGPATQPEQPDRPDPSTQPEVSRRDTTRLDAPTTAPDSLESLTAEMLALDRQLATAIEILCDSARYKALLAKAPTTAAEEP